MSLEDQVARLANAIAMHDDVAVREIIRQRDAAFTERDRWKRQAEYNDSRRNELYDRLEAERRKSAALRGVITRMKAAGDSQ